MTGTYGAALRELRPDHVFYLDVSCEETLRRHAGRAGLGHVTPEMMRGWYRPLDLLGVPGERVVPESSTVEQTVTTILHISGLAAAEASTPCPVTCPRCAEKRERV